VAEKRMRSSILDHDSAALRSEVEYAAASLNDMANSLIAFPGPIRSSPSSAQVIDPLGGNRD
jgi:hypothetical protein